MRSNEIQLRWVNSPVASKTYTVSIYGLLLENEATGFFDEISDSPYSGDC